MKTRVAVIWETPLIFTRLVEDCGHGCELVTPHLIAAPFFRRKFNGVLIPSGFGDPRYSTVLAALRAINHRVRRFVEEGGTLLVFGAGAEREDAYDWLPAPVSYQYGFSEERLSGDFSHSVATILQGEEDTRVCDGTFPGDTGQVILSSPKGPVLIEISHGNGRIILTSLHEYPNVEFLKNFCTIKGEGLL